MTIRERPGAFRPARGGLAVGPGQGHRRGLGVYARVLLDFYRRDARGRGIPDGRTGILTVMQRFGYRHSYCDLLHE